MLASSSLYFYASALCPTCTSGSGPSCPTAESSAGLDILARFRKAYDKGVKQARSAAKDALYAGSKSLKKAAKKI